MRPLGVPLSPSTRARVVSLISVGILQLGRDPPGHDDEDHEPDRAHPAPGAEMLLQHAADAQRDGEQRRGPDQGGEAGRQHEMLEIRTEEAARGIGRQPRAGQEAGDHHHLEHPRLEPALALQLPLRRDPAMRPGKHRRELAETVEADVAEHDADIERDQRQPDRDRAGLRLKGGENGRRVLQHEGAEHDRTGLHGRMTARQVEQAGNRGVEHRRSAAHA